MIREYKMDIYFKIKNIIDNYIKNVSIYDIKKYFKNNTNFKGLLDDIQWYGIQLVKDEDEYKSIIREILNDIIDNYIAEKEDKITENSKYKEYYKNVPFSFYILIIERNNNKYQINLNIQNDYDKNDYDKNDPFYEWVKQSLYSFFDKYFKLTNESYIDNAYNNVFMDYITVINIVNYFKDIDKDIKIIEYKDIFQREMSEYIIDKNNFKISDLVPYAMYDNEYDLINTEIGKNGYNNVLFKLIKLSKNDRIKQKFDYLFNAKKFDLI